MSETMRVIGIQTGKITTLTSGKPQMQNIVQLPRMHPREERSYENL